MLTVRTLSEMYILWNLYTVCVCILLKGKSSSAVQCGTPTIPHIDQRIVGGQEARDGAWPWMVMLKDFGNQVCGGTILNEHFVLTAAHCFEEWSKGIPSEFRKDPTQWEAFVGKHDVNKVDPNEALHHIKTIIMHPQYDNVTVKNDIALLELQEPIQYNTYVQPVCIPPDRRRVIPVGTICYSTGWGDTRGTGDRTVLNQVGIPMLSGYWCSRPDWYGNRFIHGLTFCAGYMSGGKDTCTGDSGGPYSCKHNGRWYQQGIISWGFDCAQPKWPGIYTDVSKYGAWIRTTMQQYGFPLIEQ